MVFIDINTRKPTETNRQSVDELLVDGYSLRNFADGYKQMYTAGRAFLPQEVETSKVPGRDGEYVKSVSSGTREIEVGFKLVAEDEQDLREQFARINMALRRVDGRPLKLQFRNDDGFAIDGYLTGADKIEERSYVLKGTLTFTCYDGYFYKQGSQNPVSLKYADAVIPSTIHFTPNQARCTISNGTQTLRFRDCTPGERLRLTWQTWGIKLTTMENYSRMHRLVATENPEEFYVRNGSNISVSGGALNQILYRDVK